MSRASAIKIQECLSSTVCLQNCLEIKIEDLLLSIKLRYMTYRSLKICSQSCKRFFKNIPGSYFLPVPCQSELYSHHLEIEVSYFTFPFETGKRCIITHNNYSELFPCSQVLLLTDDILEFLKFTSNFLWRLQARRSTSFLFGS